MEAVFCMDAGQEEKARRLGLDVPLIADARFYVAEDYHQKYYLRLDRTLLAELADYTPRELTESTVATRLNGYVAGRGSRAQLQEELPRLGLSAAATTHLERLVAARAR